MSTEKKNYGLSWITSIFVSYLESIVKASFFVIASSFDVATCARRGSLPFEPFFRFPTIHRRVNRMLPAMLRSALWDLYFYGFTGSQGIWRKKWYIKWSSVDLLYMPFIVFFYYYYSIICHCLSYKLQELLSFYLIGYFFQFIDCLSLDWWLDVLYRFIFRLKGQLVGIWIKNKEWADILICLSSAVYESRSRQTNDQTNLNYVKIAVELTINKNKVA